MVKVLVTGGTGNAGQRICKDISDSGFEVRSADVAAPANDGVKLEFLRCDTRTPEDARRAVSGVDAVIHLAAWHSAHRPRASDATTFAVNVDGTFNIISACKELGVKALVYASSMAYGWHSVYAVTKVIGEELCKEFRESTGASVAMLRYNEFIPRPYLDFGAHLLTNGVDRRDVSAATLDALKAVVDRRVGLFRTIVHNANNFPDKVASDFGGLGRQWCEKQVPGASALIEKYGIPLPDRIEEVYDLTEAEKVLGWKPKVGFIDFLKDLRERESKHEDIRNLWVPSELD